MKWLRNIVRAKKTLKSGDFRTVENKAKAGIDFTIKNYGKTLIDLSRYDRGESYSR
ncbi:MAG TPA: hypothetical protein VJL39_01855 [Candidatus Paceibacterota bacterium]